MKPSDLLLGVIDFFSTLVPGAILAFLVMTQDLVSPPRHWPVIHQGSPEGWVVFLISAYLLGHLVVALASTCLDPLYDRVYARWRRASAKYVKVELGKTASRWKVTFRRITHIIKKSNPDDELLASAKVIKGVHLQDVARVAKASQNSISNTFWWAGTVVRARIPSGSAEIDALSAQSKLFRSITVIVPIAAIWVGEFNAFVVPLWITLFFIVLWRFFRLRWDATQRTYEYFLVATLLRTSSGAQAATYSA